MSETSPKPARNVFYIGLLSFFGGISQDLFIPILPLYYVNILGFDKAFVGLSEGLVTSGVFVFRFIAGWLTDRLGKKKAIVFVGYASSLIARPLLAATAAAGVILALRFLDGAGKGLKDSPKDALIADSTHEEDRGKGFGLARALDTLGSVGGPSLLFGLLYAVRNSTLKYHLVLVLTPVPLIATLCILVAKVRETQSTRQASSSESLDLPRRFYLFLGIMLLFSIGNSSDSFLILRAQSVGITLLGIPLVYALFNATYAAGSVPLGSLSDRVGREKVVLLGWLVYTVAYLGFALASAVWQIWTLFAFYGLYYATTEGVAKAFVADMIGSERRGRAYGIYNATVGLAALPASYLAGLLWDAISPAAPFFLGAACSLAAIVALALLIAFGPPKTRAVSARS